jgi:hypothetical protein
MDKDHTEKKEKFLKGIYSSICSRTNPTPPRLRSGQHNAADYLQGGIPNERIAAGREARKVILKRKFKFLKITREIRTGELP